MAGPPTEAGFEPVTGPVWTGAALDAGSTPPGSTSRSPDLVVTRRSVPPSPVMSPGRTVAFGFQGTTNV